MFTQYTRWTHWSPNTWATPATELQPLHNYLLRMRSLSEPSELSEKISFKEFCFGSDVIWRVGSGLIWRGVRSQVEKRVFDFLQTFLFCSDASVPVWSEQVCGNLKAAQNVDALHYERDFNMIHCFKTVQNLVAKHYPRYFLTRFSTLRLLRTWLQNTM